jgi:site-specific recombinase XerD
MGLNNDAIVSAYRVELESLGRAKGTIKIYMESLTFLREWAGDRPLTELARADLTMYMAELLATRKPETARTRYKALSRFYTWLTDDMELIERSPMAKMKPPQVPQRDEPVLTPDEIHRLLGVTSGKDPDSRRDHAILSLLLDCGLRIGEVTGLQLGDVDLRTFEVTVMGKGRKMRRVPFGRDTHKALMRYESLARPRYADNDLPHYWLGLRGPLTAGGIDQMLRRRGVEAGIPDLHAHRFRHTFASVFLAAGGAEGDLMRLAGWSTRSMLDKYASATASQRARDSYQSPLDGLRRR